MGFAFSLFTFPEVGPREWALRRSRELCCCYGLKSYGTVQRRAVGAELVPLKPAWNPKLVVPFGATFPL